MASTNFPEHNVHSGSDNYWFSLKRLNSVVSKIGSDQSKDLIKQLEQLLSKPELAKLLAEEPIFEQIDENGYLNCLRRIMKEGCKKIDRTGVGTLSVFGIQVRYNLRDGCLPLFTTKRVFSRGIIEELLWFIKGSTHNKELQEKGVHIWDANGTKEFLSSVGLSDREEGDLGPIYGFQWRHWGAKYVDSSTDYSGQGIDQLKEVIEKIKSNPNDRRLIVSAWNVSDIPLMALPPCHCLFQFYVADGKLSCRLDQRSADMGLGVPFNVASYAILTHMVAHLTNLEPGDFIHQIGDAHIYLNHIEQINLQLSREPRPFPKLQIKRKVLSIDDFTFEDFEILNYNPHPSIKMQMAT